MTETLKPSISVIGKLMWAVITVSIALLLLDPSVESIDILGISTARSRLALVAPVSIIGMLLARQAVIRNAIDVVRRATDLAQLRCEVTSSPLPEFMRWKLPISLETIILTSFQGAMFLVPSLAVSDTMRLSGCSSFLVYGAFVLIFIIVEWNYLSMRKHVYEPLLGDIKTPD